MGVARWCHPIITPGNNGVTPLLPRQLSYSGPPSTCGFGIREKICCGLRFFSVFLCGFVVFGPPLCPPYAPLQIGQNQWRGQYFKTNKSNKKKRELPDCSLFINERNVRQETIGSLLSTPTAQITPKTSINIVLALSLTSRSPRDIQGTSDWFKPSDPFLGR